MIDIKTKDEIGVMRVGGRILAQVLQELLKNAKPGVSELELDSLAEKLIRQQGAEPAFKRVKGYKHTICVSVNETVVHGIPTDYKFEEGDIVGIDCGVYYGGFNTDMAETVRVKGKGERVKKPDGVDRFLETGKNALEEAIKQAKIGNHVAHISQAIQNIVEGAGYSIVRSLVGHGVGRELHEEPEVPGFLSQRVKETLKLESGMTIAVEVIYNQGKPDVVLADDGWTIKTKDGSLAGLYERTIAITGNGPVVLTS